MPPNVTVRARNHFLNVDASYGKISISPAQYPRFNYPKYQKGKQCQAFTNCLKESFRLHSDPKEMADYTFELIGATLADTPSLTPNVVVFGPDRILYSLIGGVIHHLKGNVTISKWARNIKYYKFPAEIHMIRKFDSVRDVHAIETFDMNCSNMFKYQAAIKDEISGILNRSVRGLSDILKRGYIKVPEQAIQYKKNFFMNMDKVGSFLEQYYVLSNNHNLKINLTDILSNYMTKFPHSTHFSRTRFADELSSRGIEVRYNSGGVIECTGIIEKVT